MMEASQGTNDISGKVLAVDLAKLKHEIERHSNAKIEMSRGQLPLDSYTFEHIVDTFTNSDIVENISRTIKGEERKVFALAKEFDGYFVLVEAVGGKNNPNIVPEQIVYKRKDIFERDIETGKSISDIIYGKNEHNGTDESNSMDIKSRVTVAADVSNNTLPLTSETLQE